MNLSTALWTNCAVIDLSCVSAVHPLAAAITERSVLLGAGIAKRIPAEKDALIDWLALTAAEAGKIVWLHFLPPIIMILDRKGIVRLFLHFGIIHNNIISMKFCLLLFVDIEFSCTSLYNMHIVTCPIIIADKGGEHAIGY